MRLEFHWSQPHLVDQKELAMRSSFAFAAAPAGALAATPAHAQTGAATYQAKCMMCHSADGSGTTPAGKAMGAIAFSTPAVIAKSDADLIATTTNGKLKMPSYKAQLTAPQIAAVVTYIRTLQK
jgi:mono/diheme cytochrome c family protein